MLRQNLRHHGLLFFTGQRPDQRQLLRHFLPQRVQQVFKQRERLGLVFVQRVALGIATKAHNRPQMFQRHQMLAPLGVDGLQQQLLFNRPHGVGAKAFQLGRHQLVAFGVQPFQHHALIDTLFRRPFDHRQVHAHLFDHRGIQAGRIPLVSIAFGRQVKVDQIFGDLMAHILGHLTQIGRLHDLQPLAKDRLALVVHHIVKFQQLLADVKVAALNLGLRPLQRLVHPRMLNRFAFLQAQRG